MADSLKPGPDASIPEVRVTRRDVMTGAMAISISFTAPAAFAANPASHKAGAAAPSAQGLAELFRNPPQEFAPIDNWWWEAGQVDKEKMVWQLKDLKEKGIGGTWFYVRWVYGESLSSIPHYWTDEWWDFTRFSVAKHQEIGLTHWFSNWTLTQFQQDLVRKERESNPSLWGRKLTLRRQEGDGTVALDADEELLDAAAYRKSGDGIDYASRKPLERTTDGKSLAWKSPGPEWVLLVIATKPWDINYLDPKVGQRFSEAFLGEYEKRIPGQTGKTLEAFGADEMILLNGEMLYSQSLLDKVRKERGYDVTPFLIALFHDIGPKTDQIRCDYYDALTALLEESFYQAPSTWLESRGMKHATLSQLGAGDPLLQTAQVGDFFRYLRTFHVPGNEDPGRTLPGERRLLASKLSSSIAHLYERDRVVMCVHYASGWGMTQEENLAWTHESYAKGLNLYCRHGSYHTLMGGWYEWVPPMDHFYQPHWRYWKAFTQRVTRLSAILSQGKHRADVALFYPISTIHAHWVAGRQAAGWEMTDGGEEGEKKPFDPAAVSASESLQSLAKAIYHDGIDFNFMDNASLERATVKGGVLEVAGVEFRSVVLPALTTIRLPCMQKLREFYENGGTVIAYDRLPTASAENGRDDPKLRAMLEAVFGSVSAAGVPAVSKRTHARGGKAFFTRGEVSAVPPLISGAIVRDVSAPEKDLFHIHKKVGALDVYFLFNVKQEQRELPVRFRAQGNVSLWDTQTGEQRPLHRVKREGEVSEIRLTMNSNEAMLIVFSPGTPQPAVLEDNVSALLEVKTQGELALLGFDATGGQKTARLVHEGKEYVAQAQIAAPPARIALTGPYTFSLEPTMDNRWGDFRYPASKRTLGAEARRFRYAEEQKASGTASAWHRADFDDSKWEEVTYSYGAYWWHIGPLPAGADPRKLLEQAQKGNFDEQRASGDGAARWRRFTFSKKFGFLSRADKRSNVGLDGMLGVPENFLVLDADPPGDDAHCFFTNVQAPQDGDYFLHVGARPDRLFFSLPHPPPPLALPSRARAWVNGNETKLDIRADNPDSRTKVRLRKGLNTLLIELVRPKEGAVAIYAALFESEPPKDDAYLPLLRWFREEPQRLVYDIAPGKAKRVGWYRFKAPPGTREIHVQIQGKASGAWVDGQPVAIENGKIALAMVAKNVSQVALRVEQEPGTYGGAVFPEPVSFECGEGQIPLGDWSPHGLATYSGVGVYSKGFNLEARHLENRVFVDLGVARSAAEVFVNGKSAGVLLARPFRVEVTHLLREGENTLLVKVANTLANHMSTYPTKWVLEGQTVSGLLGPVEVVFEAPVKMIARKA